MIFFIILVLFLWLFVMLLGLGRSSSLQLSRERVYVIKGICAVVIVLHHLSYEVSELSLFRHWGAPVVSLFFALSGYGLITCYRRLGDAYLNDFLTRRVLKSLLVPYLPAWLLYRLLDNQEVPSLLDSMKNLLMSGQVTLPESWFVYAILVFYLFFYIVCKLRIRQVGLVVCLLVFAYMVIVSRVGYSRCWYVSALSFPAGILYADYGQKVLQRYLKNGFYNHIFILFCCLVLALYFTKSLVGYSLVYAFLPLMLMSLFAQLNIEGLIKYRLGRYLCSLSYEIYLSQGIGMFVIRKMQWNWVSYVMGVFLLTFLAAYVLRRFRNGILALNTKFLVL